MKPKTMILMVVAVGCGLAASYMTSKLLAERNQKPAVEEVVVLTAKKKVPKGTILKNPKEFFDGVRKPKAEAPAQYFRDYNDIRDKKMNKELKQGVHITPDDVADRGQTVLDIPDGMGAIGLKITAVSSGGYFIKPGNKVDVILTTRGENAESKTILRDVLVLAVGDQPQGTEDPNARATIHAQTVTVALASDDAQLVRVAETAGDLSLLLRKDGDISTGRTKVMTKRDLIRAGLGGNQRPEDDKPASATLPPLTQPDRTGDEVEVPTIIDPDHKLTILLGGDAPRVQRFWKGTDGQFTTEDPNKNPGGAPPKKKGPAKPPAPGKP